MFNPKNILVPFDFTQDKYDALKEAIDIASEYKSHIYLLHVIENDIQQCVADYCLTYEEVEELRRKMIKSARLKLDSEIKKLKVTKNLKITPDVKIGNPYDQILKEQKERGIDLIVAEAHKRNNLKSLLHNGLVERIARNENVDTLIVH